MADDYRKAAFIQPPSLVKPGDEGFGVWWAMQCIRLKEPDLWPFGDQLLLSDGSTQPTLRFSGEVRDAVTEFQRRYSLAADGLVGPQFWSAMHQWSKVKPPIGTLISAHLKVSEVYDFREYKLGLSDAKRGYAWRVLYKPYWAWLFEKMRKAAGKPITINSFDRSPATNKAVGGVSNSRHLFGHAGDYDIAGFTNHDHYLAGRAADFLGVGDYDPLRWPGGYGHADLGLERGNPKQDAQGRRTWSTYG